VPRDVHELAGELTRKGESYVLATVVWRRGPSSGKEGNRAVIMADGKLHGWISGACAEPVVIRQGLQALADGTPRLVYLGPPEDLTSRERDGLTTIPSYCASEGALEIYVEPVIAKPHLVVVGRSPAVDTLLGLAAALDWRTVCVDDEGTADDHPAAGQVVTKLDLAEAGVHDRSLVVIATQGHYDESALEAALATEAAYIGVVASRKRAASVIEGLRAQGISEESIARVHVPAGLDLGHVKHEEIAVSVIAELVKLKGEGALAAGTPAVAAQREEAVDPVCNMTVDVATARFKSEHQGETYYFCCPACKKKFDADPASFLVTT
jgi:xanthine dehydrogenase accessory factor